MWKIKNKSKLRKALRIVRSSLPSNAERTVSTWLSLPGRVLIYVCFSGIIINSTPFTFKCLQLATPNTKYSVWMTLWVWMVLWSPSCSTHYSSLTSIGQGEHDTVSRDNLSSVLTVGGATQSADGRPCYYAGISRMIGKILWSKRILMALSGCLALISHWVHLTACVSTLI